MRKIFTIFSLFAMSAFTGSVSAQISSYCTSNATSTADSKIDSVVLNTLASGSNSSTCETYTNNTSMSTILSPGGNYTIRVRTGSCGGSFTNYQKAWIDFDQNGTFDAGEQIINTSGPALATYSNSFTVPATALGGNTFMRVISTETSSVTACGTYTYGETEDYAITILSNTMNDAGVSQLVAPTGGCAGVYDVRVRICNYGINQINPVTVQWSINGNMQNPMTHSSTLDTLMGTGNNCVVLTLGQITLTGGTDTLKLWTTLPNNTPDTSNLNDTLIEIFNSLPVVNSFPYYETFGPGEADWFSEGTLNSWAFGTPNKSNINGAASDSNAWVVGGLTGSYNPNEESSVNSPCFDLSAFEGEPWVALDANWYSESSYDGAVVQSSVDGGKTWQVVGEFGDPYNWYNRSGLIGTPGGQGDGWAGTATGAASGGWVRAKHALDPSLVGKNVRFRIAFGSDGSVQYEGFAFDNFTIVDYKPANLGPDVLSLCEKSFTTLDPHVNFMGSIVWSTGDSINETINVSTTGSYWVMYTDSLLDLTSYDTVEMIETTPPQINFASNRDTIILSGSTTLDPKTPINLDYDWQPGGVNYPYLLVRGADHGVGTHVFELTVTDSVECKDVDQVTVVVIDITGIDNNEEARIKFFPNPVQDVLNVNLQGFGDSPVVMQVLDIQGKMHMNYTFDNTVGQNHQLNLGSLDKGTYLLKVQNDSKHAVVKIMVN